MKVAIILGTRPEIIKNYAIVNALREAGMPFVVLSTNQHGDAAMSRNVFSQMGYEPHAVMGQPYRLGTAIDWIQDQIRNESVDLILVNGDTAAALAGALAAVYSDIGLAHVEAGLRSFDARMYEERNRVMVDSASHYLFTYTQAHADYLAQARDYRGRIILVGNTTVDVIEDFAHLLQSRRSGRYAYVTLHRKELTDHAESLAEVLETLNDLALDFDSMVLPLHPRTRNAMMRHGLPLSILSRIDVIDPILPFDSLALIRHATVVVTDSGTIQEEAHIFGTPCVTVRANTERPETLVGGGNVVCGLAAASITEAIRSQYANGRRATTSTYGPAGAGRRIVAALNTHFKNWLRY